MQKLLLFLAITVTLLSCNNDDDNGAQNTIEGKWNLVSVTGGFGGVMDAFETGTITHTFANGTLVVLNNNTNPDALSSFLPSGTYSYEIVFESGVESLLINDNFYQIIEIASATLELGDDVAVDGFSYSFKR